MLCTHVHMKVHAAKMLKLTVMALCSRGGDINVDVNGDTSVTASDVNVQCKAHVLMQKIYAMQGNVQCAILTLSRRSASENKCVEVTRT